MSTEFMAGPTPEDSSAGTPDLQDYAKVGPYRLLQQLGQGGMGVVHLALDPHGKAVAIKVMRAHVAADADARARLAREVETLGRIKDPRVAAVLDADVDADHPYIVTRYVPGPALDTVVGDGGPMPPAALLSLGKGLAGALHAIHEAGVVHRDVKPGNVLLLDDDPVLIDFGIAHLRDSSRLTMTGLVMGTPGYLAPEVVEGDEVSEATDWWGWAATLAFAASGRPPFGRGQMETVLARVVRGDADLGGVDPDLRPLLFAALSPRPAERPDDGEVIAALQRYAQGRPVTEALPHRVRTEAAAAHDARAGAAHTQRLQAPGEPGTRVLPVAAQPRPAHVPQPATAAASGPQQAPQPAPYQPVQPLAPAAKGAPAPALSPMAPVTRDDARVVNWPAPVPPTPGEVQPWPGRGARGAADPRIGRPQRTGTLAAALAAGVAGMAAAPVVTGAVALLGIALARTTDRSMTSIVMRRYHHGLRRGDVPMAVLASPWHLVTAVVSTIVSALLPVIIGVSATFCAALVLGAATGSTPRPGSAIPLAVGALLGALMAWWGPGGASLRRGTRSIVRGTTGAGPGATFAVVVLLLIAAVAGAWVTLRLGDPTWWPTVDGPGPFGEGGITLP
ncbi:protein kinase domain-containing protein [Janibacter sp. G56]|uniref:serine/threonine-protein kinase n=1 Tax=Janibacter sp. G56 TaxID=3418717 RepID=UPI003D02FD48